MNQNQVPASPQSDFPHQSFLIIGWKWNEQGGPKAWEKFGANFVSQNIVSNSPHLELYCYCQPHSSIITLARREMTGSR